MLARVRSSGVPFRVLALHFRFMTRMRQPLQVVKTVVVAGDDVVAVRADPIAFRHMMLGLASAVRAHPDLLSAPPPIIGQSAASVAAIPVSPSSVHVALDLSHAGGISRPAAGRQ